MGLTITASAAPSSSPPAPLSLGDLRFDWPIPDALITSPFGYRNDVNPYALRDGTSRGGGDSIHMGLDLIPKNATAYSVKHTQVLASEAGDVWIVFPPPGTPIPNTKRVFLGHPVFGGCVMLRHIVGRYGDRVIYAYTLYGHMREVWVSEGTKVKKGDPLGLMGTTGESTGAHIHFEILFDPMDFLLITNQAQLDEATARTRTAALEEKNFWLRKNDAY